MLIWGEKLEEIRLPYGVTYVRAQDDLEIHASSISKLAGRSKI